MTKLNAADTAEALAALDQTRESVAYHFARVLLERRMPFAPAPEPDHRVSCSHLAAVVERSFGARVAPLTWAVALHDLGVDVAARGRGGDIAADISDALTIGFIRHDPEDRSDRFAWASDTPAEALDYGTPLSCPPSSRWSRAS